MKLRYIFVLLALVAFSATSRTIDLSGKWQAIFPSGKNATVNLPGTLDMAGVGDPSGLMPAMEKPQLLRLTRKVSYVGPCAYSRVVEIPAGMAGKPLRLKMERVLWKSTLKIDGKPVAGENISLTTPHRFEIPPLKRGRHTFEITVDNSRQRDISFSDLCHSYTNDTQTMWNGVLGDFTLSVIPAISIEGIKVYPDLSRQGIDIEITVDNATRRDKSCKINLEVKGKKNGIQLSDTVVAYNATPGESVLKTFMPLPDARPWSDITPELYDLKVSEGKNSEEVTFGMREVSADGKALLVNGRKVFLRGTLDCCVFPLTGVPPTDHEGWEKEMKTLREWGFNHIRFHSWCPPEAAFEVADSMGLYLQTELPVWSLRIGDDPAVTEFLRDEFRRMSDAYGNHPSWIMSTCGNELQHDFDTLNGLVAGMREFDPRRLYAATSFTFEKGHGGHPEPCDQFLITQWTDDGWVRGQGVFDEKSPSFNDNYSSAMGCVSVPLISHEIGQYAVYPDLSEIGKYTGVLDPLNFKAIRDDLRSKGLLDKADDYLRATGRFAKILYKEEIERAMKTPGFSGVQLLGIQDFPGQGTALVGLVNAFWEGKGVVDATEFRQFNSPVVPLASFPKAVYTSGEDFRARIDVANYGGGDLSAVPLEWSLADDSGTERKGVLDRISLPQGEVTSAGEVRVALDSFRLPSKLTFRVSVPDTEYENCWNVWLYPAPGNIDSGEVKMTSSAVEAGELLAKGEKVLFLPAPDTVKGIESKFLPVFWSPVHFPKQAGGMGILCDSTHPALKGFPNDGHSDWQWWMPVKNATVMLLDSVTDKNTSRHIEPIVGVIDNFLHNRRLGYLFEARCGKGTVMVSSMALKNESPEMKSLLQGILDYMNSESFAPSAEIEASVLEAVAAGNDKKTKTNSTSIYE